MPLRFEWDIAKAEANLEKHGISFEEATTLFDDPFAFILDDIDHSAEEQREIIIGHTTTRLLLVVSFTEKIGDVIRLISARPATRRERKDYEENSNFQTE
jgi:uncharacterized protein